LSVKKLSAAIFGIDDAGTILKYITRANEKKNISL
jgi:hypothetical protein